MTFLATVDASPTPKSIKFRVFSQLARGFGFTDGFARDSLLRPLANPKENLAGGVAGDATARLGGRGVD